MKFLSLAMYVTIPLFAYGLTTEERLEKVNKELDELQDVVDQLEQHEEEENWGGSRYGRGSREKACRKNACSCHKDDPRRHKLINSNICSDGFETIKSWEACKRKAEIYGFRGDATAHVDYMANDPNIWGNNAPWGCFRSAGNRRFHFNSGNGVDHKNGDQIFCQKQCEDS